MAHAGATVQLAEFLAKTNYQDLPGSGDRKNQGADHGSIRGGVGQLDVVLESQGTRVRPGYGNQRRFSE